MQKLDLGFSIADGSYPDIKSSPGTLVVSFNTSGGNFASIQFTSVAAYAWQEADLPLGPSEPWDGACELKQSPLLSEHSAGSTMHSVGVLRHFRLRFHPWGSLDVIAINFAAA